MTPSKSGLDSRTRTSMNGALEARAACTIHSRMVELADRVKMVKVVFLCGVGLLLLLLPFDLIYEARLWLMRVVYDRMVFCTLSKALCMREYLHIESTLVKDRDVAISRRAKRRKLIIAASMLGRPFFHKCHATRQAFRHHGPSRLTGSSRCSNTAWRIFKETAASFRAPLS